MTEFQELTKEEAGLFLEAIKKYDSPCNCCGKKVNGENFGIIHSIGICCNSILCQSALMGKLEEANLCKCPKCGDKHEQEKT